MYWVKDEGELGRYLDEIEAARQWEGLGNSRRFSGVRFWNVTGNEDAVMFPTIYWHKSLEEKVAGLTSPSTVVANKDA